MRLFSIEAEQNVLGGLIRDNNTWDKVLLETGHFHRHDHQKIFTMIANMIQSGEQVDIVTLTERFEKHGTQEEIGGLAYIATLAQNTATTANIASYAKIVKDYYIRRQAIETLNIALEKTQTHEDPLKVLSDTQTELERISHTNSGKTAFEVIQAGYDFIELAQERAKQGILGAPTGLRKLDERTGGIWGQKLWLIAGRPSLGKSALVLQFMLNSARAGYASGMCSLEMPYDEIATRIMANVSGVNGTALSFGNETAVSKALEIIPSSGVADLPMHFDDSTYDLTGIVSRLAEWKRKYNIAFGIVDHAQIVEVKADSRREKLGEISRRLKQAAKRLDMPILLLSQLNRDVAKEKRRPRLDDLKESGDLEQDADIALFLHSDNDDAQQIPIELGLLKNRGGKKGWIPPVNGQPRFLFEGSTQRYIENKPLYEDG